MLLFNDYDLEDYIIHEDIEIQPMGTRENYNKSIPSFNGNKYIGMRYGEKKIIVPFKMDAKTTEQYTSWVRTLSMILNTKNEAKLILPDEVDKYYWAVMEDFECKEILKGVGEGRITFVCYDPYAYSDEYKIFESDTKKITTVLNEGTTATSPSINVAFTQEAHFLQCTNWDGRTVLVGDRPSVDNDTAKPNDTVLHDPCEETTNWLPAGNVLDQETGRIVEGSVTISYNGDYITALDYGTTIDQKWHGAAVRRNIGQDVEDFELTARFLHNSKEESSSGGGGTTNPTNGNYEVTASSLNVRSGRGSGYSRLGSVKKGTKLNITDIQKSWGKITFNSKTGYVHMDYVKKITSSYKLPKNPMMPFAEDDTIHTENKMGRMELYGFDRNGVKLFKFVLRDSEEFYEYTQPELFIGNKMILEDGKSCPAPKKKTIKDENDKNKTVSTESGRFGDWNEYYGDFTIKRETKDNKQYWSCSVTKIKSGKVLSSPKLTKTNLVSSDYPKGKLNHVVLWFGKYKDKPEIDEIGLTDLKVKRVNPIAPPVNVINFANGDELEIDCKQHKVYLNGAERMDLVDIGSEFFSCEAGMSQFICQSDDSGIGVSTVIQDKWI